MMALVASIEWLVAGHLPDLTTNSASSWSWSSWAAGKELGRADILCFGDSLVKFGVVPSVIERRLGRPAGNLALLQGVPAASYFLLRRSLDAGARPLALIVDGELLERRPSDLGLDRVWPELASLGEGAEVAWLARDPDFFAAFALARTLNSVRARREIRGQVAQALRGEAGSLRHAYYRDRWNWDSNRGGFLIPTTPHAPEDLPEVLGPLGEQAVAWSGQPDNVAFLEKFLGLANSRGIPVFFLLPPTHPGYQRANERNGHEATFLKFVRDLQGRHHSVCVIDGRHSGYDASSFFDLVHLNRRGAIAFTSAVSEILADRLARPSAPRPGWAELPMFREPVQAPPVDPGPRASPSPPAPAGRKLAT